MDLRETFNASAASYDATRRQLIPCFDDFYGLALGLLPHDRGAEIRVLDLGAGTGIMSQFVLQRFSRARPTLVDVADDMLQIARDRFAVLQERVTFLEADYSERLPPGPFDLIVSALFIHHLEHERKRHLFRAIHDALMPDGFFINADQVAAPDGTLAGGQRDLWIADLRRHGVDPKLIAEALERQRFDIPATAGEQVAWLREAGFSDVEIAYKYLFFTVFVARA
jgi:tRNA (cmo5U34)-methyltransferase